MPAKFKKRLLLPNSRATPHKRKGKVILGKGVLKIYSKYTRENPCRSEMSIKLLCNFTEITLWHGCSLKNLLHIFRTLFSKNTTGGLLLKSAI